MGDIRLGGVGSGGKESLARCLIGISEGRGGEVAGGRGPGAVLEAVEGGERWVQTE